MSYVFTAPQQAEIDVLVNELTDLEVTLPAQQATLDTRRSDWRTLVSFVERQPHQKIWSTEVNPETELSPRDEEVSRRIAANDVLTTYSIPAIHLPDILCGNAEVIEVIMREVVQPLIFGTIEADIQLTRETINTKKDALLQYYENLVGVDPII